jgi:putative CocE/NonD family hydrolase
LDVLAQTELAVSFEDASNIKLHWGIRIALRDGVQLNATIYTPRDQRVAVPCILTLTPYVAQTYHDRGVYFAAQGYPFVIVDVRGRGNSEGEFRPLIQEAKDGYDVVEWLARQPYCDGQVAMWGGSYAGYDQWATAKEFPPHLATIVPVASPYAGVDFPMCNNIFYPYVMRWITYTSGKALQDRIFADANFWSAVYRQWWQSGRAFCQLDAVVGNPSPIFQEWLTHPKPDEYWDAYNPTGDEYARLQIPILTITGSNDDDQRGALEHYRQHMRFASAKARARHYLIIGPWDHSGTRTPLEEFGGLKFGPASLLDLPKLHLEWYAWALQNGPPPSFLKEPVAYYVMGAEKWRYAKTLESVTERADAYYLDSPANANHVFAGGSLGSVPGQGQPDTYSYDPREVDGWEVDAETEADGGSLVDQRVTLALCGKLVVYHSAPFEKNVEISGFFRLCAWISIDCPDADLYVSVSEVALDGSCCRLTTDAIRARYREGLRTPKLICTNGPLRYDFDRFTFVSRQVRRGNRLRLIVAPMGRLVEATFAEKNYQGGGVVAKETAIDAKVVTVSLFHDREHPSALYVPFGREELPGESTAPLSAFATSLNKTSRIL